MRTKSYMMCQEGMLPAFHLYLYNTSMGYSYTIYIMITLERVPSGEQEMFQWQEWKDHTMSKMLPIMLRYVH